VSNAVKKYEDEKVEFLTSYYLLSNEEMMNLLKELWSILDVPKQDMKKIKTMNRRELKRQIVLAYWKVSKTG
jgi:hypothetical protein